MVDSGRPALVIEHVGPDDLDAVARRVADQAGDQRIWLFLGDMGAGKTTFIKALAHYFGVTDTVSSPTYGIVNEYRNNSGMPFYHFDFYRISDEREAEDIGVGEYFDSGNYCFIEWPERIERLLPDSFVTIRIQADTPTTRRFEMRIYE